MNDVADLLGYTGEWRAQRVRRYLARCERMAGVQFVKRSPGWRGAWHVTLPTLKEYVPELFSRRDETLEAVREKFEEFEDSIDGLAVRQAATERNVNAIDKRVGQLESKQRTPVS
jgi:hypothetical protein